MPENTDEPRSPTPEQTGGTENLDATALQAKREEELRRARDTVTRAGVVLSVVERSDNLNTERRQALEVLRQKLTELQQRIDRTDALATDIEATIARIDARLPQVNEMKREIAIREAEKFVTIPRQWQDFVNEGQRTLDRQRYLRDDAAAHPEDPKLQAMEARRRTALELYNTRTPRVPTSHNWQPNAENQERMFDALTALNELSLVTEEYEQYRGIVDGIRKLGDRSVLIPSTSIVTLDVRRGASTQPNMIVLSAQANEYTSGTGDLTIKKTGDGWEVTMKPDFTGTLLVNRTQNSANWNRFSFGTSRPNTPSTEGMPQATERPNVAANPTPPQRETPATRTETPAQPAAPSPTTTPAQNTPARSSDRSPDVVSSDVIRVPANRIVYVRMKGVTNRNNYLQPNFSGEWHLESYAIAKRSPDGKEWVITRRPGYAGGIETSLDRVSWQEHQLATRAAERPTPETRQPPVTQPESTERGTTEFVRQTGEMTIEFPVEGLSYVTYKTPNAMSLGTGDALRPEVRSVDFYLYTIVRAGNVWRLTMKPGKTGAITVTNGNKVQTVRLGQGMTPPARTETAPAVPRSTETPPRAATEAPRTNVPPPPPESVPAAVPKSTSPQPRSTTPESSGLRSRGVGPSTTPTPQAEVMPVTPEAKQTLEKSEERIREMYPRYIETRNAYEATMRADYAKKGGSIEWKLFDQEFSQLQIEMEEHFGGNTPQFTTEDGWRSLLSRDSKKYAEVITSVSATITKMQELLKEYQATKIPEIAPATLPKVDTLALDIPTLRADLTRLQAEVRAKTDATLIQKFNRIDGIYEQAYELAKSDDTRRAVLACWCDCAKNYASADTVQSSEEVSTPTGAPSSSSWLSGINVGEIFTAGKKMLESTGDSRSMRRMMVEQAQERPVEFMLTPAQLLELVKIKRGMDRIRADKNLSKEEQYDKVIDVIGDHSGVLEYLQKEFAKPLQATRALGWEAESMMKDVFNPETIDWLLAAYNASTPIRGMSDSTFFFLQKLKESSPAVASAEPKTKDPTPVESTPLAENNEEEITYEGRLLTPVELFELGIVPLIGEEVRQLDDGSYIACSKLMNACRPIEPTKKMEQEQPTPVEKEAVPTLQSPEGIDTFATGEFRLPSSESFTVEYENAVQGASPISFAPGKFENYSGSVIKAQRYKDVWVVNIAPEYRGKVTLMRHRDRMAVSLKKEADGTASLVAVEKKEVPKLQGGIVHTEVSSLSEFEALLAGNPKVIVDFYKVPCPYCDLLEPTMNQLAQDRTDVVVLKIDGGTLTDIRDQYMPIGQGDKYWYPTVVAFEQGRSVRSLTGNVALDSLKNLIPYSPDPRMAQNK